MKLAQIDNLVDIFLFKIAVIADPRLKQLASLKSFAQRKAFCEANFPKLKAGSSRIVYDYTPEYVLKLAKNEKGLEQNRTEADGFMQQHYKELIANVIDSDPNDLWIVSEKASKISKAEFMVLTKLNFDSVFGPYIQKRFANGRLDHLQIPNEEQLDNDPFVSEVVDMMANFNMPAGDICRISSWGKVRNRAVLIDYGITNEIFDEYYR